LPRLNIPTRYKSALAKIASLTDAAYDELKVALKDLHSIDQQTIDDVAAATPDIAPQDVERILESLTGMQMARTLSDKSVERFCQEVIAEFERDGSEPKSPSDRERFASRLTTLLSFESLAIAAKSNDLQSDHDRIYLGGRILTDIRPVFHGSPEEPPAGVVLTHTLKLSYLDRSREGERANFYIALDGKDLASLKKIVERAEQKNKSIRTQLRDAGISCFGDE
jgi:hypothetical protein